MTPAESDAIDAVLIARGYRIIGNVSPDIHGVTDEEVAMLFVGDVKGAIRDLYHRRPTLVVPERETATRQTSATVGAA